MAVGDVKFTWTQRERLHRYVISCVYANVAIGFFLLSLGVFATISLAGKLQLTDRNLPGLVFKTLALYGFYILVHNLVGVKLCRNYFHHAEGSRMNFRLFIWTLIGLLVAFLGCFMASLCSSTGDQLAFQLRRALLEGMKKYLTDVTWKRMIDNMQLHMGCCGIDSYVDWHKTYWLQRDLLILDSPDILEYAELDGRVTPPVVPWSCCRIDVKGPCYHDPLQLPNPEQNSTYESLNARGCLIAMKAILDGTLYTSVGLIVLLFVLQVVVTVLSRFDFTAARNAVALGGRRLPAPGWLFGRLDFGNTSGPNLCQIDRVDYKTAVFDYHKNRSIDKGKIEALDRLYRDAGTSRTFNEVPRSIVFPGVKINRCSIKIHSTEYPRGSFRRGVLIWPKGIDSYDTSLIRKQDFVVAATTLEKEH